MTEEKKEPTQVDGEREAPNKEDQYVHLPSLISDEFGTPRSQARMHISEGKVLLDGEEQTEKFDFKRADLVGKKIEIVSSLRRYSLNYKE